MNRFASLSGLTLALVASFAFPPASLGQQFRKQMPGNPQPAGLPNNVNPQQPVIGFNVAPNGAGINNGGAGLAPATGGNPLFNGGNLSGLNTGLAGLSNPFQGNTSPMGSPFQTNMAATANYYSSLFGNPYALPGGYPPGYNPYYFWGTGYPTGTYSPMYPLNPAQVYNYNLNMQYLTNPYLNPLSNPAFSGPFQPNAFNALAPLNAMGFNGLLGSMPLPVPNMAPNNNNNPAFP
jgi:hypothetical protein